MIINIKNVETNSKKIISGTNITNQKQIINKCLCPYSLAVRTRPSHG